MLRHRTLFILPWVMICLLLASCKDTKTENRKVEEPYLRVSKTSLIFKSDGGSQEMTINSNSEWKIRVTEGKEWITVSKASESVAKIEVKTSFDSNKRTGRTKLTNTAGKSLDVIVVQYGSDMTIQFEDLSTSKELTVDANGDEHLKVGVAANTDYNINIPDEAKSWISLVSDGNLKSQLVTKQVTFNVLPNKATADRTTTITFTDKASSSISISLDIIQKRLSSDVSALSVTNDKLIRVISGRDSEHQPGQGIENSYDGNGGKKGHAAFHTPWGKSAQFPVTLEYYLDTSKDLTTDYIVYTSRNGNGNFGFFELWIKEKGSTEYVKEGDYDFKKANGSHHIYIKNPKVLSAVKFVVSSGYNDFVSCEQMEFFHSVVDQKQNDLLRAVFTDLSCSALKTNVTEEQINKLPEFFKLLATSFKSNTYPKDEKRFRIQDYSCYSIPEYWADQLKINSYSHLNNPVGIFVKAGEEIVVLADKLKRPIQLMCVRGQGPSGDSQMIKNGINRVKFNRSGNLFVVYEEADPRPMPKIRIHIPPQAEKGVDRAQVAFNVWDINIDKTNEKYREYLAKAIREQDTDPDSLTTFILKGNKIMFTVLKSLLEAQDKAKKYGVAEGIKRWDEIMGHEQELAAIDDVVKSGKLNNVIQVTTFPEGLYATAYHINMAGGKNTEIHHPHGWGFKNNFDPRDMDKAQDNQWGVGHELGHMHQGAINWPSTWESSNNLFSNYIVTKIDKWGSRGSSLTQLATYRYNPPTPWARFKHPRNADGSYYPENIPYEEANKHGLYQGEDSEMHMRLNQQLWTYFSRTGKDPEFMQKLFKLSRQPGHRLPFYEPGKAQLQFARNVAEVAGMDMTEFFDTWCFFIPVKGFTLWEYGSFFYQVTQEEIDETLEFMKKFKKKCPPIEFIEDRRFQANAQGKQKGISHLGGDVGYFTTFQNDVKITKSVTYRKGTDGEGNPQYTISNGDQAVGYELRKGGANGERVWFSNRNQFSVPKNVNIDGAKPYAVQADGQRIAMGQN